MIYDIILWYMARIFKPITAFVEDYLSRHRNNIDKLLHIIGVPLVFLGIFQICTSKLTIGFLNLFLGYLLQWIGHAIFEKNEVGEWILIKKIVKKIRG